MKKSIVILGLLAQYAAQGQITLERKHLVRSGLELNRAIDTLGGFSIATSGANKVWDFTSLNADVIEQQKFVPSDWALGYENCKNSNLAYEIFNADSVRGFFVVNQNEVRFLGSYFLQDGMYQYAPWEHRLLKLPATFGQTYGVDSSTNPQAPVFLGVDPDDGGPMPTIDSFKVIMKLYHAAEMDGYGTLKTPLGSFAALKQTHTMVSKMGVKIKVSGFWLDAPQELLDMIGIDSTADTSFRHMWWTNDSTVGMPLLEYSMESGAAQTGAVEWLQTKPQSSGVPNTEQMNAYFLFPNPASYYVILTGKIEGVTHFELYDASGRLVRKDLVPVDKKIVLAGFNAGLYTMVLRQQDRAVLTRTQLLKVD